MKKLFLFDFDGTLTRRDTFLDFILFDKGILFFLSLFIKHFFQIIGYKLNLYSAEKLKVNMFNAGYLGTTQIDLENKGKLYLKERASKLYHDPILEKYTDAVKEGHDVYLVSASMDVWLRQFVKDFGGNSFVQKWLMKMAFMKVNSKRQIVTTKKKQHELKQQ